MTNQDKAFLIMDMQMSIVNRYESANSVINNIKKSILYAREQGMAIIYVNVGFRQNMPEVSVDNKTFYASKQRIGNMDTSELMKIHPDLTPTPDDLVVTKHRFSAFSGSDLEMILRSMNIKHLILSGIATSGVVLSTLLEASDKDFVLTVLSDACTDTDADIQNILVTKIFPTRGDVLLTEEWTK